ncbi:MAG: YjfB family protein [Verrucomicrobia bacterium]|nr:YjfB family protein [Verrucomicrobiota bacterium]
MTISGSGSSALINSAQDSKNANSDVGIALLKKAQDQMKQQGEAMVKMIEQSSTACSDCHKLDVYA